MLSELAPVLMVQGASSSAGKSTLVTGLCRLLARRGLRVAPFKAQNMSNNAAVCAEGGEIGRAQYVQALAANIEPTVDMNPVLLKPQGGTSQVIVRGQVASTQTAREYFSARRLELWPVVCESLDRLRREYQLVIAEGAGSPAEINLRSRDLTNMAVALHAAPAVDVLLVADIDRGGAFAALLGTFEWLAPEERALVRGFVLNKFRGDASLLAPAPALLEARTGVPVVGVVPFLADLGLPDEDAATLSSGGAQTSDDAALVEIAIVRVPHISNFDEFRLLAAEPGVRLRYVDEPGQLRAPDLVIVPGSKATIPDLLWLRERGLAARIAWLAQHDTPVLGICGGMQMLGRVVRDPLHVESPCDSAEGLGLLPLETMLDERKTLRRVAGIGCGRGFWSCLQGIDMSGYEIHVGQSGGPVETGLVRLGDRLDGIVEGRIAGTYIHGLLESDMACVALLRALAQRRGYQWQPSALREEPFDRLADVLEVSLDLTRLSHLKGD